MKVFNLDINKKLIYRDDKTTKEVDVIALKVEINVLNEDIEKLLAVLKDSKKLLLWAKDNFADCSELLRLQSRLEGKEDLLKEVS